MEVLIGLQCSRIIKPIYCILLFAVFINACMGQDNKNLPEIRKIKSSKNSSNQSDRNKQTAQTSYIDQLFFIEGQLCQHLRKIAQDKNGNLWMGTNVYGLMCYDGDTLEYFDENEGLGLGRITGILEDKEGNVWFSTAGGLTKYDAKSSLKSGEKIFTNFMDNTAPYKNEMWSVMIDSKGDFWIGSMEGVSRFDGQEFTNFLIPKASVKDTTTILSYDRVTCIIEDRKGVIWFGTDGFGICKYDPKASLKEGGKSFSHITKKDGLCDNNISSILEDKKGNIWIGTMYGGLSKFDPKASLNGTGNPFTNFTQDGIIEGIEVCALYEDKKGSIWFAAEHQGLYRYDPADLLTGIEESFTNFYKKDGLNTGGILSIFEDNNENFWLGGWGGLFRFDGNTFISVTKNGPWEK